MTDTNSIKKTRTAFFVSGEGSLIECAYNFLCLFPDEVEVPLLVFDSETCTAFEKLKKYDVSYQVFNKGWKNEREIVCDEQVDCSNSRLPGRTPRDMATIRRRLQAQYARIFTIHSRLMTDLKAWAAENDVGLVDVIELLDQDRDLLISWVHLHPTANRMIAEALAQKILEHVAVGHAS